jgi:hypothetical protein
MEQRIAVNKKHEFYVSLPNLRWAIRKSQNNYKWAVIAQYGNAEDDVSNFSDWYVARWSSSIELATKHANYLETGCPAVKKHGKKFITHIVPVEKFE